MSQLETTIRLKCLSNCENLSPTLDPLVNFTDRI